MVICVSTRSPSPGTATAIVPSSYQVGRRRSVYSRSACVLASQRDDGTDDAPLRERSVAFHLQVGTGAPLFYRPASRLIRDLGVLALSVLGKSSQNGGAPRVLDAMSGSGVRTLRYSFEANASFVHANELMFGEHPLRSNLAPLTAAGRAHVTSEDAINLYMRARLEGNLFDLVDCDAFGTGQPHTAEAWWAVRTGGLLYLCATDSLTTSGQNPHQAVAGYAAVAHKFPACNEAGLRLLAGTAAREAAARHLTASPVFSYFHRPSSSFRVMMRLDAAKRPPAVALDNIAHVARCDRSGQFWKLPSRHLGDPIAFAPDGYRDVARASVATSTAGVNVSNEAAADGPTTAGPIHIMGPMWVGPMHDAAFVAAMASDACEREWQDAVEVLDAFAAEASAEAHGALLFYHLGEVQRALAREGLQQPPLAALLPLLRAAGYGAAQSHTEAKSLKTSASLNEVVRVVRDVVELAHTE